VDLHSDTGTCQLHTAVEGQRFYLQSGQKCGPKRHHQLVDISVALWATLGYVPVAIKKEVQRKYTKLC